MGRAGFGGWGDWGFGPWAAACGPDFGKRGPRKRVFDRGDLKYVILRLLWEKPMHGYEVMQALEAEAGGWYSASPGSVYPVLQLLQDQGYVTSEDRDGKRVYTITEAGRAFLTEHSERVDDVTDRISAMADRFTGPAMGEVTKSFVRFAQASFEEAMRRAGNTDALKELRDVIDRATRDVRQRKEA